MSIEHYFHNCSKEYIDSIDAALYGGINSSFETMPKQQSQSDINGTFSSS